MDAHDAEGALGPALHEIEEAGLPWHRLEKHLELPFAGLGRDITGAQRDALAPQHAVFTAILAPEHGLF